jgi:transcriptional regulator with XRE-family HTH domain
MTGRGALEIDQVLGRRIRMLRQVVGIRQDDLAARCGLTFEELDRIETCAVRVHASTLYVIAQELGADIAYFYEGPNYEPRPKPKLAVVARRPVN